MKWMQSAAFAALFAAAASAAPSDKHFASGEKEARPVLGTPGTTLFADDFSSNDLKKWKVGKGFFEVNDGVVKVTENPADHHGAYFKAPFAYKNVAAEFSFKFDGAKSFNFTMDDLSYKGSHAGHICRITISPTKVSLGDSKNGVMKLENYEKNQDPKTTPQEKKKIRESFKDLESSYDVSLDSSTWHKAYVEIVGDEMLIEIDGKPAGYLKAPGIAHETKQLLGFTVTGKSLLVDDVKAKECPAAANAAEARTKFLAELKK